MMTTTHLPWSSTPIPTEIRLGPLRRADLARLVMPGGRLPEVHRERFALQQAGAALYLLAWHGARPIGHVLLKWRGVAREPMASALQRCPHICDLYVIPEYQSRGIGTRLMDAVERLARMCVYPQVGLSVAVDNFRARRMYEQRGYHNAGFPPQQVRWTSLDAAGAPQVQEETVVYLVKRLGLGAVC